MIAHISFSIHFMFCIIIGIELVEFIYSHFKIMCLQVCTRNKIRIMNKKHHRVNITMVHVKITLNIQTYELLKQLLTSQKQKGQE